MCLLAGQQGRSIVVFNFGCENIPLRSFLGTYGRVARQNLEFMNQDERTRYSDEELKEFEVIISEKLDKARSELKYIKESLSRSNDEGTDNTSGNIKVLEDGADMMEKENLSQLASRQQKFIIQLENAMVRIKNGTYGICVDTGKLISKERLKAVPHTMHSIEAKLKQSR